MPPVAIRPGLRDLWMLRQDIAFLNHGSFGAVPRAVYEEQDRIRRQFEAEPIELLGRRCDELLAAVRVEVASFVGADASRLALVSNATEGINAVLRSLDLRPGDELLTTNHVYNAVRQAMKYVARQAGAHYREALLPMPLGGPGDVIDVIAGALTPRTRLLVIDHVTSPTALIFPVRDIVELCRARGVDVLIDGAHAPGMVELDVESLGAAYYAGNLHKWFCAPKGSAFLHIRADRLAGVHPCVISHRLDEGFEKEFAWTGTRDISAFLATPRAIGFLRELGLERIMRHNHELACWGRQYLCRRWDTEPLCPATMLGSMATLVPPPAIQRLSQAQWETAQRRLYHEHRVEAPLVQFDGRVFVRIACQAYNTPEDIERLGEAVGEMSAAMG